MSESTIERYLADRKQSSPHKKSEGVQLQVKTCEYDKPRTPYKRLMDSGQLTLKQEENLRKLKENTNPFTLQKQLNEKLK